MAHWSAGEDLNYPPEMVGDEGIGWQGRTRTFIVLINSQVQYQLYDLPILVPSEDFATSSLDFQSSA